MAYRKVSAVGKTKRRKSTAKRSPAPRRRRISGTGKKMDVMEVIKRIGSVAGGIVGGRLLNAVIVKQAPTFSPMMSGLIQIGAGAGAALFFGKNPYIALAGLGLAGQGVAVEAVNAGLISGVGADRVSYRINGSNQTSLGNARRMSVINGGGQTRLNGAGDLSVVNGASDLSVINGRGGKNKCV